MLPPLLGCHAVITSKTSTAFEVVPVDGISRLFSIAAAVGYLDISYPLCWAILNSKPKSESFAFEIFDAWIRNRPEIPVIKDAQKWLMISSNN